MNWNENNWKFLYASMVESLMYTQTCTWSNISFLIRILGKYIGDIELESCKENYNIFVRNEWLYAYL